MFVVIATTVGPIGLIIAHALCSSESRDIISQYWRNLSRIFIRVFPRYIYIYIYVICAADTNARAGSQQGVIGPLGASQSNFSGRCYIDFLERHNFFVPDSFPQFSCFSGYQQYTYVHNSGFKHQIDRIAFPQNSYESHFECYILHDTPVPLTLNLDHIPIFVKAKGRSECSEHWHSYNKIRYDKKLVEVKKCFRVFCEEISNISPLPNFSDGTPLQVYTSQSFQAAMQTAFPLVYHPRLPWISSELKWYIGFKNKIYEHSRKIVVQFRHTYLRLFFYAWQLSCWWREDDTNFSFQLLISRNSVFKYQIKCASIFHSIARMYKRYINYIRSAARRAYSEFIRMHAALAAVAYEAHNMRDF